MGLKNNRVVITGIGVVSSIGIGKEEFWKSLISGKSGISKIESIDTSGYSSQYGGEIKKFKAELFVDRRKRDSFGRSSLLGIIASKIGLEDADIKDLPMASLVSMGTTLGEIQILENINDYWVGDRLEVVNKKTVPMYPSNVIASNIGLELKLKGENIIFPTACAAGNYAIGYAFDSLKDERLNLALAGGADGFSRIAYTGFNRIYAMASEKCQPFDKNRKGMMLGEGAAILVLESLESALRRKANIYAEVLGYGLSCDAHHMTQPKEEGISKCMTKAMDEAGIGIEDVDYISAHGTGTPQNDKVEVLALSKVFGKRYKKIPTSSIKSMLGHTMGAASAIEAATCCLALKDGILPPTMNYETPDPECDIDCVPNKARKQKIDIALNNSYAFGGNNACLVLKKFDK